MLLFYCQQHGLAPLFYQTGVVTNREQIAGAPAAPFVIALLLGHFFLQ